MMHRYLKFVWLSFVFMFQSGYVGAIDLQPGDVIAPRPGINAAQVTYQYSERNDFYSHGDKQAGRPAYHSSIYALRAGHSFEVAQMPAYFYAQVPFGAVHSQGKGGDSGMGDTTFAFAVWPYADRSAKTYFGAAFYLTLPTGSYDSNRYFNMGENRYSTAVQVGYERPLADKVAGMVAFDAVFFGDNTDASQPNPHKKLEKDVLYTAQFGVRYDFNQQYSLTGTYYYTAGGETTYDGVDSNNATRLQRYQLSGIGNYSFGRITVHYSSDLKTENGYFEDDRLTLRYTMRF